MAETARYLYAVSRGLGPDRLGQVAGLRGAPVQIVSLGGLEALVSDVPLSEFDEVGLKENLESLTWLEDVARGHDQVVQAAGMHAAVAPLRLATICLDDDAVRRRLEEWHDDLHQVLDRVQGRVEWSVKVILPPESAPSAQATTTVASGAEYLQRKKAERERRDERLSTSTSLGDDLHRDLAGFAVATRLLAPQDPRLAGYTGTMLLNGAYLVDADEGDLFRSHVDALAEAHPEVNVDVAGPWPPYSFAVLDQT